MVMAACNSRLPFRGHALVRGRSDAGEILIEACNDLRKPVTEILIQRMYNVLHFLSVGRFFMRINL